MSSFLTRFEEADIIGLRALDLATNAEHLIDPKGCDDDLRLALMELRAGKLELTIRSYMPNGVFEDRETTDLRQRDSSKYALAKERSLSLTQLKKKD